MPRTDRIADPAMKSSPEGALVPTAAPATPSPINTAPTRGERTDGARSPLRPASTATTSCREAMPAGTTAASNALATPNTTTATRCSHGTWNGPNHSPEMLWTNGRTRNASPTPTATPSNAAVMPRTQAPASTTCQRLRRESRRERQQGEHAHLPATLTANAAPVRTTSMSAITTTRTATASVVWFIPPCGAHLLRNLRRGRWVEHYCPRQHGGSPGVEPPYVVPGHRRTLDEPGHPSPSEPRPMLSSWPATTGWSRRVVD